MDTFSRYVSSSSQRIFVPWMALLINESPNNCYFLVLPMRSMRQPDLKTCLKCVATNASVPLDHSQASNSRTTMRCSNNLAGASDAKAVSCFGVLSALLYF